MADYLDPDLCVIGAGSGGLTVAAAARALDASVVLIERGKMGGDCLNYGCVPSKSLIAAAKRAHVFRSSAPFGIAAEEPKVNFGRLNEHIKTVIAGIAPHDSVERYEGLGATVIQGTARFADRRTIEVEGQRVRARRFVIATGSRPAVPPIEGLDEVDYLTNETIFDLTAKPSHLMIIGAGPIGLELAQAYSRLGSEVTVFEMAEPLHHEDPELSGIALRAVRKDGVSVHGGATVVSVAAKGNAIAVNADTGSGEEEVTGSHLLVATGRQPNIEELDLDAAGVRLDGGRIRVGRNLKTTNRRIYAIGDLAGDMHFTHTAGYHAGLVVRNALFRLPVSVNAAIVPRVTYTDPEIAHIGPTESEARERYGDKFKVLRWDYANNDRLRTERRQDGLLKVITDRKGRILGAGAVGPNAGEVIAFYSLAIANRLRIGAFTKAVMPYPTLNEVTQRIAYEYYRDQLSNPWLKRLLELNRLFG